MIKLNGNQNQLPPELRLFIAISLPQPVKDSIQQMQRELQRGLPSEAIRWARSEQFHLTLKFLGSVSTDRVEALTAALSTACAAFATLQLHAGRLGLFPNARSPRVLWAGIEDTSAQLSRLQVSIEAAARPFTVEPAEKQFRAHVTLARLRNPRSSDVECLSQLLKSNAEKDFGHWTATEVNLMRSSLASTGSSHFTLATIPLLNKL